MTLALIRARVLGVRSLGHDVRAPLDGEDVDSWTTWLFAHADIAPVMAVACTCAACSASDWWERSGASDLTTLTPDEASALLSQHAQQPGTQRETGTFYTADDVSEHVARTCIDPLLVMPAEVDGLPAVLDPTCGSGAFLRAAAAHLDAAAAQAADAPPAALAMHGVDIDPVAVESCRALLLCDAVARHGAECARAVSASLARTVIVGDAVTNPAWGSWFPEVLEAGGFHAVIGNPPYVRMSRGYGGNACAIVTRDAAHLVRPGGRLGLVLPVSVLCTDSFEPLRDDLDRACDRVWAASFDAIPSTLFPGTVQRIAIVFAHRSRLAGSAARPAVWRVTRYHRWRARERAGLLERMTWVPRPLVALSGGSIAKVGTDVESSLLKRVHTHEPASRYIARRAVDDSDTDGARTQTVWYKRRWSYFLLFLDFVPHMEDDTGTLREPTEFKPLHAAPGIDARVLLATFSSSLFWWWFGVVSDNRNVNRRELESFPMPDIDAATQRELCALSDELMASLREHAEIRRCTYASIGTIRNTYFRQARSRDVLDRIDAVLARWYGMTVEEHAFVLGHEARFRGGDEPVDTASVDDVRSPALSAAGHR